MKTTILKDGTKVYCLKAPEAKMLDHHVDGYLKNGISVNEGDVIFDVGANIGIFGLRAAQKNKDVTVFCFEPIPDIAEVLIQNASEIENGKMIVKEYGLSNEPSTAEFTYFPNTPALSTFKPEDWDRDPKAFRNAVKGTMKNPPREMRWMKWIPTFAAPLIAKHLLKGNKRVICNLRTVSSVVEEENVLKIDILKVDCEGAELAVLQGIKEEHWPLVKSAVIEIHDIDNRLQAVKDLIRQKGFRKIVTEREAGLEETKMYNLFAVR